MRKYGSASHTHWLHGLAASVALTIGQAATAPDTIRVNILHSLSGTIIGDAWSGYLSTRQEGINATRSR